MKASPRAWTAVAPPHQVGSPFQICHPQTPSTLPSESPMQKSGCIILHVNILWWCPVSPKTQNIQLGVINLGWIFQEHLQFTWILMQKLEWTSIYLEKNYSFHQFPWPNRVKTKISISHSCSMKWFTQLPTPQHLVLLPGSVVPSSIILVPDCPALSKFPMHILQHSTHTTPCKPQWGHTMLSLSSGFVSSISSAWHLLLPSLPNHLTTIPRIRYITPLVIPQSANTPRPHLTPHCVDVTSVFPALPGHHRDGKWLLTFTSQIQYLGLGAQSSFFAFNHKK